MKTSRLLLAATALAVAALGAQADEADGSQFAAPLANGKSRAEVQADLAAYKQAGVNPWSISYNPLKTFRSGKTRAEVTGEFLASRDAVAAMNGEDSGSAYLAQHNGVLAGPAYAGQPQDVNGGQ